MARRHLAIGSFAAAAFAAAALYLVGAGSAGTSNFHFDVFAGPTTLHTDAKGVVFARFQPDASSGSATHTVFSFTFPVTFTDANGPTGTTSDCITTPILDATPTQTGWLVTCTVGTVNPGQIVKRFVTYTAPSTPVADQFATGGPAIVASVSFDTGTGGKGKGGGAVNSNPVDSGVSIVDGTAGADGTSADGNCGGGGTIQTAGLGGTVIQQTQLTFGSASTTVPCSWGSVGVINGTRGKGGASMISSVGGPIYTGVAHLTLTFASLPLPLSKYVLEENETLDPRSPDFNWFPVPPCDTSTGQPTLPQGADTCINGPPENGKVIVFNLLYRGTNGDPFYN